MFIQALRLRYSSVSFTVIGWSLFIKNLFSFATRFFNQVIIVGQAWTESGYLVGRVLLNIPQPSASQAVCSVEVSCSRVFNELVVKKNKNVLGGILSIDENQLTDSDLGPKQLGNFQQSLT